MPKIGLKDVLALRAAGYSKKEIEALAEIDEENEKQNEQSAEDNKKAQGDAAAEESNPEPDYKSMYEDILKQKKDIEDKNKEIEEKIKKLQQENINKNSGPDVEKQKEKENKDLLDLFRSSM